MPSAEGEISPAPVCLGDALKIMDLFHIADTQLTVIRSVVGNSSAMRMKRRWERWIAQDVQVLAGGVRGGDGVLGVLFHGEQDSRAVWGIPAWRELFQEGFWRELFQEVSGAGVSSWLGADVKVSFCFISSLWLQSRSLLSMCLWPFWWNKWDCSPTRSLGLLCSTKRNSKPLESVSWPFFLAWN